MERLQPVEQKKRETVKQTKLPITQEQIFKIMYMVTVSVSLVFFAKNLLGGAMKEALLIGVSIGVFAAVFAILKARNASEHTKQMMIAIGMMLLIFIIGLNSGEFLSDDFIMFLAVIALTGLYLEPKYTNVQLVIATAALVLMYMLHPDKADPLGQYIQCIGEFVLTGALIIQVLKRGRAFIELGEERAKEAETLVESIRDMGASLESDFSHSKKSSPV